MQFRGLVGVKWVRPPLMNLRIIPILYSYITLSMTPTKAINMTPIIDCEWVEAVPKV